MPVAWREPHQTLGDVRKRERALGTLRETAPSSPRPPALLGGGCFLAGEYQSSQNKTLSEVLCLKVFLVFLLRNCCVTFLGQHKAMGRLCSEARWTNLSGLLPDPPFFSAPFVFRHLLHSSSKWTPGKCTQVTVTRSP